MMPTGFIRQSPRKGRLASARWRSAARCECRSPGVAVDAAPDPDYGMLPDVAIHWLLKLRTVASRSKWWS